MVVETEMAGIGCKPEIALEIDGVAAILDLVADGVGHAVPPRYALANSTRPQTFVARTIEKPHLISRLALATAAGRTTTMTQQAMIELIQQVAQEIFSEAGSA
jgi:LysR family nitrogen assimilation transcriptional regulator